jgi:hypothetical protein
MPINAVGHVYLIESVDQGLAKIGFGTIVIDRLRQLQTGNPCKLSLYSSVRAEAQVERTIQRSIVAHRVRGEWYSCVHLLRAIFCSLEEDEADVDLEYPRNWRATDWVTVAEAERTLEMPATLKWSKQPQAFPTPSPQEMKNE